MKDFTDYAILVKGASLWSLSSVKSKNVINRQYVIVVTPLQVVFILKTITRTCLSSKEELLFNSPNVRDIFLSLPDLIEISMEPFRESSNLYVSSRDNINALKELYKISSVCFLFHLPEFKAFDFK